MSYTLTDLYDETDYTVQVQNVCDNNSTSVWKAVSFRTTAIFLNETFTTGTLPTGWARYDGLLSNVMNGTALTPNTAWAFGTANGVFDSHAYLKISGNNCYSWLVTPTIVMEDNVQLTFDLALTQLLGALQNIHHGKQNDNKFVVLITTDGGTTWNILRQWDNQGSEFVYDDIVCSSTGETVVIDLSSYAGQNIALAFYGESTEMDYLITIGSFHSNPIYHRLRIDNVRVDYIPDCDKPRNLVANNIMGYNATLNWTGDADSWIVAYKTAADADFTEVPVTEHPYTLADLIPETFYTVKVRTVCGELYSEWSSPEYFTTDAACPAPTNLSATNIIHNAATIRWTSYNENFQLRYRKQSDTDWIMVDNPTSPYRLTGLEPDTYYTVEVRANCGDDGESLWATRDLKTYACSGYIAYVTNISPTSVRAKLNGYSESFTVKYREAAIEDAPFKEDFEDDACLNDWTFISMNAANNIGNPNGAGRFSTAAHWGNYGFRFSSENAIQSGETYDQYLISPQLNTTGELKFYINCFLDTDFYVGYSTTTNDLEAFTWTEYRISYSQTWQIHRQQLPDDVKYVAFHYYYIPSIANQKFYIDDITIGTYEIEPAGPWNYVTTEETTIILDNLTGGTEYEAIVVPSCDETHESMTVSFTTLACTIGNVAVSNTTMTSAALNWTGNSDSYTVKHRTAAYFEGISGEDFGYEFPSGWTRYTGPLNADGTGPTTPVNSGWSYFPSWSYGTFKSNIHPNWRNWLVTRAITINPGCSLSFNVRIDGEIPAWNPGNGGRFAVLISTDNKVHWTILREWNNTGSPYIWNNLVGPYQTINDINLNAYIGQTVHIAFYVNGLSEQWYGNDLYLSDVTCGRSIAAGAWQTVLSTGANTATIGNLYPDTKYDAVVVPSCDPTLASDIVSFSTVGCSVDEVEVSNITEQSATVNWNSYSDSYTVKYRKTPSVSYPYEMGFEDENAFANWTFISNNAANALGTTNGAGIHHTAAHGGLLGFRFSSYNTVEGGEYNAGDYIQYLISPLLTVSGNLRFYYRKSNRLYEGLSVGYSTTTNNLNAFTWTEDIGALQEWQAMTLSLPANVKYIAFRYNGANSYYAHIDDITIGECIVGNSEAWSTMNTSQATANLSNLTPGTEYEVKVSPSCDPSFESDVVYFTTKACSAPHFAEVSNISQHSVTVTWVGESESYNVKYRVVGGTGSWLSVSPVYTTTCTITAYIRPGLDYEIVVVPLCDETLESNHVFFSTPPCTISEDLEISDITHHSATVSWTGCSESYTVQYREAAGVLFSEDFEDAESFAEWTFISMNEANAGSAGRGTAPAHHGS